jgi:anti-anti-sigma factor
MDIAVNEINPLASEVVLIGRLDTAAVDAVELRFNAAVIADSRHVLVNLTDVDFVSSMGLRLLFTAAKSLRTRQKRLLLLVPSGPVREMLEMAAVDTLLPMFEQRDDALATLLR